MPVSKRNRRGLIALLVLGLVIAYTPRILAYMNGKPALSISFEELQEAESTVLAQQSKSKVAKEKYKKRRKKYTSPKKRFDPNNYLQSDWMALGLSEKQTDVILKFTERGIRSNEDLKKIFVLPDELYALIKDSTFYPVVESPNWEDRWVEVEEKQMVDLNSASHEELKSLKGIGDYYARKIIERRQQLGGYVSDLQLLELWKFKEETLLNIREQLHIDSDKIKKRSINSASIEGLKMHPYIDYKVANSIVKMREANGNYHQIEDIMNSKLIDLELFEKLKPYIQL